MSLLDRILGRETRASIKSDDPYLAEFFGMRAGVGGYVDPSRAAGLATAQACISIMTQSLAAVPLNLYRWASNGGRERETSHPLYTALHDMANPTMTAFEAREMLIASLLISGNAYARIEWNARGQAFQLHPLDPGTVTVERLANGRLRYRVTPAGRGGVTIHLQEEILHLRYRLGRDGAMGLSPIQLARETFNLALTQQDTAGKQAEKGFRPEGALVFPQMVTHPQRDQILTGLENKIAKNTSTAGILVLDGGTEWRSFNFSSKDAEFLESRKLTGLDICRIYNVPATVAGYLDNGTYSNVEMESRALVTRCLAPLAKRIEQAMNVALLPPETRKRLFIEHDLAGLLRGDLAGRYNAYRTGRDGGWLSVNEIRGWENLSDIEGGDTYLEPLNMTPAGERGAPPVATE